jgi:hypothetical protein
MQCHNASLKNDYSGPGIENPHPFPGADKIKCTVCHGGNPKGEDQLASHVPPPPEIGDEANQIVDPHAYFNRLTLAGIDKFPSYVANGKSYSSLDYLQFINPGDLRVVSAGRACGQCHARHAEDVARSPLGTSMGIFSGAAFAAGAANALPASQGLFEDTASDYSFRAVSDPSYAPGSAGPGEVGELLEQPVWAKANRIVNNPNYTSAALLDDINPDGTLISGSPLAELFAEQVTFTCGDCHLGSAGANNRAGDFRSSGCAACHMQYSLGGRSGSSDPNINKLEPLDPDDIDEPERSHARKHRISSVARTLSNGEVIEGIDDYACAGCHQGSNRTVMQYWGIRLDQNQDVHNDVQYPLDPLDHETTFNDQRLFPNAVNNNTFNGRNHRQYLLEEDYDGDNRDDTPADVHYDAGLGCIDCHGSFDLHGGDTTAAGSSIKSRMEHGVAVQCENCHGSVDAYAPTAPGERYDGTTAELAMDSQGNPLRHVVKENGDLFLYSRLTGNRHYISQTLDVVVDSGKLDPLSGQPVYSAPASYAMGRDDADPANGIGPHQTGLAASGFSHMDNLDCAACHSSWTNTCMGCHLVGDFDFNNNFSNITGEPIVFEQEFADFTYQSPLFFTLGVDEKNKVTQFHANTKVFFNYQDQTNNNATSATFFFSDRKGQGNNPSATAPALPSLAHNSMLAHSIRGKVTASDEGPRYCVACHLTTESVDPVVWKPKYDAFRAAMESGNWGALDYNELAVEFGRNPGNQRNTPYFVHMAAGLGTGLFLCDDNGRPLNPIDTNPLRRGAFLPPDDPDITQAPSTYWNPALAALNLDRVVEPSGVANGSNNHAMLNPGVGPNLRDGALDPNMAGPLGATLLQKLADPDLGIVLDAWFDADGQPQGDASLYVP